MRRENSPFCFRFKEVSIVAIKRQISRDTALCYVVRLYYHQLRWQVSIQESCGVTRVEDWTIHFGFQIWTIHARGWTQNETHRLVKGRGLGSILTPAYENVLFTPKWSISESWFAKQFWFYVISLYVFVLDHFNRSPCDQHSTHTHTRSDYKVPLRLLRRDDDEDVEFWPSDGHTI